MRKYLIPFVTLGLTLVTIPSRALPQDRPEHRDEAKGAKRPEYHFRTEDRDRLRGQYKDIGKVDAAHREHFVAGGNLPGDWRHHIRPVPRAVITELPPIPSGYLVGYYDGYAVVYDPRTGYILEVLDLT